MEICPGEWVTPVTYPVPGSNRGNMNPFAVWWAVGLTERLWGVWSLHVRSVHMPLAPKAVQ